MLASVPAAAKAQLHTLGTFPWDVSPDIRGLDLIKHPALVLPVVGILLAKVVTDYFPRALFGCVTEFAGEFGRFVRSHSLECRPEGSRIGVMR